MNRFEAAKDRLAAATPGPWTDDTNDDGLLQVEMDAGHVVWFGDVEETCVRCHANAALTANAPTDLEHALAVVEAALLVYRETEGCVGCRMTPEAPHALDCPLAYWESEATNGE